MRTRGTLPTGGLVAFGAAGVRLLTADGRVKARWQVPADRLVVADHGHSALLLVHGERLIEAYRLDLRIGQVRRWACLPQVVVADTFDGSILHADPDGLVLLDTLGVVGGSPAAVDEPRAVWRELRRGVTVHALSRPEPVGRPGLGRIRRGGRQAQLWTWSIPGMTLRAEQPWSCRPRPRSDRLTRPRRRHGTARAAR